MCQNDSNPSSIKEYWKDSVKNLFNVRILVLAAIFIAIRVVLKMVFIPVGDNLNIYIGFLVNAVSGAICGPVVSLISGCISDIVGFMFQSSGAFMPLFTLIEMIGSFTYAAWFYKQKITFWRVVGAKATVNVVVNIILNSIALSICYGKGVLVYLIPRIVKNIIVLPLEIYLLSAFFMIIAEPISKIKVFGKLDVQIKIDWIKFFICFFVAIAALVVILLYYNDIDTFVKTALKQLFNM